MLKHKCAHTHISQWISVYRRISILQDICIQARLFTCGLANILRHYACPFSADTASSAHASVLLGLCISYVVSVVNASFPCENKNETS